MPPLSRTLLLPRHALSISRTGWPRSFVPISRATTTTATSYNHHHRNRAIVRTRAARFSSSPSSLPSPSSSSPSSSPSSLAHAHPLVVAFDSAFEHYPIELVVSLAALEGLSFVTFSSLLHLCSIETPALFAVAYALSSPLRRAVLPKLALAAPISSALVRIAPVLAHVHPSKVQQCFQRVWAQLGRRSAAPSPPPSPPPPSPPSASSTGWLQRLSRAVREQADRRGLALFIAYRLSGAIFITSTYVALDSGVAADAVRSVLQRAGFAYDLSKPHIVGHIAASVTLSACLFPLLVCSAPFLARHLFHLRRAITRRVGRR